MAASPRVSSSQAATPPAHRRAPPSARGRAPPRPQRSPAPASPCTVQPRWCSTCLGAPAIRLLKAGAPAEGGTARRSEAGALTREGCRPEEAGRTGRPEEAGRTQEQACWTMVPGGIEGDKVERIRWSGRDDGWVSRVSI
jgi:hypothetical protein